jgi:lysophospholipase L1-like esterase
MESERPSNLNELELEQYNLVLEEQAYPFEEKAITVHEKNIELLSIGIYNKWIDKSIEKLALLMPARYAKSEQENTFVQSLTRTSQQAKGLKSDEKLKALDATAMIGD